MKHYATVIENLERTFVGINNKIKLLESNAYSLRDSDYFALLIKDDYPS